MNVTHDKKDSQNAELTVKIDKADYMDKVENALKNYRKNANVPGFRKGHVPMSLIKKQYEQPLIYEEVNKLLQESVDKYLKENKIEILGQPLPKENKDFSWDAEPLQFDFKLGLVPEFDVELKDLKLPYHKIQVSEEDVDKYINNFRMRYGKMSEADKVEEGTVLKGVFYEVDEDGKETDTHYHANIMFNDLSEDAKAKLEGKAAEEKVELTTDALYEDEAQLKNIFGEEGEIPQKVIYKINSITKHEKAAMDQEFFDKIYGEGEVETEEAFREKVKEESSKMYEGEADRVMLTNGLLNLVENTPMELPKEFLVEWLQFTNKEAVSPEKAEEMYNKAEKGMKFQLVEGKLADKYEVTVEKEDIENQAMEAVKQQMAMYGAGMNFEDDMLKQIAQQALQNEEEYRKLADQVFAAKLLKIFKDNVTLEEKEISFEDFVEEVKAQNEKANA